jgi:hypothetical protein
MVGMPVGSGSSVVIVETGTIGVELVSTLVAGGDIDMMFVTAIVGATAVAANNGGDIVSLVTMLVPIDDTVDKSAAILELLSTADDELDDKLAEVIDSIPIHSHTMILHAI